MYIYISNDIWKLKEINGLDLFIKSGLDTILDWLISTTFKWVPNSRDSAYNFYGNIGGDGVRSPAVDIPSDYKWFSND